MLEIISSLILGILFIIIGVLNRKGNISSLHSYHRKRVKKEDVIPFGRLVGLGIIIIGFSLIVVSILTLITILTNNSLFDHIGNTLLGVGLVIGLILSFYAIIKYNKGVF